MAPAGDWNLDFGLLRTDQQNVKDGCFIVADRQTGWMKAELPTNILTPGSATQAESDEQEVRAVINDKQNQAANQRRTKLGAKFASWRQDYHRVIKSPDADFRCLAFHRLSAIAPLA